MKDHANEFKAFINYDGKKRSSRRKAACTRIRSAEPSAEELETKINTAWETYLASISKTRAWGDHLTIRAFACAYGRVVRVYQKEGHYDITPDVNGGHPIVHIAYHVSHDTIRLNSHFIDKIYRTGDTTALFEVSMVLL